MINFNEKKMKSIFDRLVLVSKEQKEKRMQLNDEIELILTLRGSDIPMFNNELNPISVTEFVRAYPKYTDEEKNRLLKLVLRKAESSYILNNYSAGNCPSTICRQVVTSVVPKDENATLDGEIPDMNVSTRFDFFFMKFERYSVYSIEGPTLDYKPLADGKMVSQGDVLSEFNLNPLDFQELYFRAECTPTYVKSMPCLENDRSNIKEVLEYWKNVPAKLKADWEPVLEFSMFGGEESRMLAYGDKIKTGSIVNSIDYDYTDDDRRPSPDKIYKPKSVKVEDGIKCTSRWIPSQNLKVDK